jgi:hypothetical protein
MLVRNYYLIIRRKLGRIIGIDNHEVTGFECDYKVISQCLNLGEIHTHVLQGNVK